VGVNGRNEAAIGDVVTGIRDRRGRASGVAGDATDYAAVEEMRGRIEDEFGPTDLLFAFAGGGKARPGPTAGIPEDDWRSSVDGNLTATFLTIKSFLPGMIERGGSIVTMASSVARFPTDAPAPYAAAKAGVVMPTRQLAWEVGEHGVRVNCLAPHTVLTDRIRSVMPEDRHRQIAAGFRSADSEHPRTSAPPRSFSRRRPRPGSRASRSTCQEAGPCPDQSTISG
jgi:3-oxoacyl-[acyl-carrier protein] reductase